MLFCVICMAVTGICPWEQLLLSFVLGLGFLLLMALSGLFLGLKMPNLNWTSELAPIKQSACVAVNLFGGFLYTLLFAAGYLMTDLWKWALQDIQEYSQELLSFYVWFYIDG